MFDIETAPGFGIVSHFVYCTLFGKLEGSDSRLARLHIWQHTHLRLREVKMGSDIYVGPIRLVHQEGMVRFSR